MTSPQNPTVDASELYVVPVGKRFVLYAPLRRAAALVNLKTIELLQRHLAIADKPESPATSRVLARLEKSGILQPQPAKPVYPAQYSFAPHEVTLFPTTDCNLRCVYCYASAGNKRLQMDWQVAKAAVDLIFANAEKLNLKGCIIGFHGGGEPTLAWDLMRRTVGYANELALRSQRELRIHLATNGILSVKQREYLIKHFSSANVSLDGPPEIHDVQRPMKNGSGSFAKILETLQHFDEASFSYGIRPTVTARSVTRLPEMVDFFHDILKLTYLHFEPLFYCGRCLTTQWQSPSVDDFIFYFRRAYRKGKQLGMRVYYSGARVDTLTAKFCAAAGDGFAVTPTGKVTSCFEVCDDADARAKIFHYGQFDSDRQQFLFDDKNHQRLRTLHVENFPFCENCFCKWHCAGDCLAKVLPEGKPADHSGSERCEMNRSLTLLQIMDLLKEKKRGGKHGAQSTG